jgi:hypothetical protein
MYYMQQIRTVQSLPCYKGSYVQLYQHTDTQTPLFLLQLCYCNSVHRVRELSELWPALAAQLETCNVLKEKIKTAQNRVVKLMARISDVSDAVLLMLLLLQCVQLQFLEYNTRGSCALVHCSMCVSRAVHSLYKHFV